MIIQPYQLAMLEERKDLNERLANLHTFIGKPTFNTLDALEQSRMQYQQHVMRQYFDVLNERIRSFQADE